MRCLDESPQTWFIPRMPNAHMAHARMKTSFRVSMRISIFLYLFCLLFQTAGFARSVFSSDSGKPWKDRRVKTVRPATSPDVLNQYGGSARHKVAAPGFFRVLEQSGRWWLVDPDGCLFLSIGVNSVGPTKVGRGDVDAWTRETYDLLKGAGFNTLGRWSDYKPFQNAGRNMPWCATHSFMKEYAKRRPARFGKAGFPNETIPVFDEAWPGFCEKHAQRHAGPLKDDVWLLGHFSDNELPFRPDALKKYLALPADDAGHIAAVKWITENKIREREVDDPGVQAAFLHVVAKRYYEVVAAALKKADPNHLYIGSRLHGRCISPPVLRAASACDVVSINYYHRWEAEKERAKNWTRWSKRPFLVGEFYAMNVPKGKAVPKTSGAGFQVLNYEDAGDFYQHYVNSLLRDIPNCVGWHWFKYADDNPVSRKGIVGQGGEIRSPLIERMKALNQQVYTLRAGR